MTFLGFMFLEKNTCICKSFKRGNGDSIDEFGHDRTILVDDLSQIVPFFFAQFLGLNFVLGREHLIHYCNNSIGDGHMLCDL
jgi:hypothetical protein